MKSTLLWSTALAVLLGVSSPDPASAQESTRAGLKPVVTVSVAGYDALMKNIDSLAEAAGAPEATMILKMMVGPAGLPGIDAGKPLGVLLETDGQTFSVCGFLPVTDADQLLGFIKKFQPDIPEPDAQGIYEIELGRQTIYAQQKNGWAFVVDNRDALATTPSDPASLLGGLNEQYTLAVRVTASNVPAMYRQMAVGPMQMAAQMGNRRQPGESAQQHALRTKVTAQSIQQVTQLINEAESLLIGLAVGDSGAIHLDFALTAVEGSELAGKLSQTAGMKTDFAGFFQPEAAITFRASNTLSEGEVAQMSQMIRVGKSKALESIEIEDLSEVEAKQAHGILDDLMGVIEATIQAATIDGGAALVVDEANLSLIAGVRIVNATKLEDAVKLMAKLAIQDSPELGSLIALDADSHAGVRFHTFSIPAGAIPEDERPAVFSDGITLVVGFSDSAAYLAIGSGGMEPLKAAIDQSAAQADNPALPVQMSISAGAIGRLIEVTGADVADVPPQLLETLKQSSGDDHLTVTGRAIPHGMKTELVIEPGFLKLIGAAVKQGMQAAAGAGAPAGS